MPAILEDNMNRDDWIFTGVVACAVIAIIIGIVVSEKADRLEVENKVLKGQNQMLQNTIEDFGQQIEELSNQIDRLINDLNRGNEWNEEAIPECRR